ncbi:hypothetical protein LTR28_008912, partial [Elasticomyces elasticus]
ATDFVAAIANACADSCGLVRPCPSDEYWHYVTHIVYLEGPSSPKVDKTELNRLGIETMRLYGRRGEDGKSGRYDAKALTQALEAVIETLRTVVAAGEEEQGGQRWHDDKCEPKGLK